MDAVARIGRVPRINPVEFPPDHPMVDEFGKLTSWDEPPCTELVMVPWGYSMWECFRRYTHEHLIASGAKPIRIRRQCYVAMSLFDFAGPERQVDTIERNFGREYTEHNASLGNGKATARHHLTLLGAWLNHSKREKHTKHEVKLWKPEPAASRVEVLTLEQQARLFAVPKHRRLQLFLYLAFNTGARSEAIEELTWDRVDFERRTIDYRVAGVRYKNKRRVVVPMNDTLHRRLSAAKEYADLRLPGIGEVIGLGVRGSRSSTYHGIAACYKRIGLKVSAPRHIARHTVATRLMQQRDIKIEFVANLLGDQISMVEKVYGHLKPSDLMPMANAL